MVLNLLHTMFDVKIHGHLNLISGFPFKDYLGNMKKMVRTSRHPLALVVRRISEMDKFAENEDLQGKLKLQKEHKHGPVPSSQMD